MPAWWTPDLTYWLLPAAVVGVPVIAGGIIFAFGQADRRPKTRAQEIVARKMTYGIAYGVVSILIALGGILEWAIGAHQALAARSLIADYPAEFGRWINAVLMPVVSGGLFCGLGARGICTWRRTRAQPMP